VSVESHSSLLAVSSDESLASDESESDDVSAELSAGADSLAEDSTAVSLDTLSSAKTGAAGNMVFNAIIIADMIEIYCLNPHCLIQLEFPFIA
jgi:hypothetical protein